MSEEYTVKIGGFKSKEAAQMFMSWYEGQGEQDIDIWKECREEERGEPFENNFCVDGNSYNEDTLIMNLR